MSNSYRLSLVFTGHYQQTATRLIIYSILFFCHHCLITLVLLIYNHYVLYLLFCKIFQNVRFLLLIYYKHGNVSILGLGLVISGDHPVPYQHGERGAFVQQILSGTVAAQLLGELKPGNIIILID